MPTPDDRLEALMGQMEDLLKYVEPGAAKAVSDVVHAMQAHDIEILRFLADYCQRFEAPLEVKLSRFMGLVAHFKTRAEQEIPDWDEDLYSALFAMHYNMAAGKMDNVATLAEEFVNEKRKGMPDGKS